MNLQLKLIEWDQIKFFLTWFCPGARCTSSDACKPFSNWIFFFFPFPSTSHLRRQIRVVNAFRHALDARYDASSLDRRSFSSVHSFHSLHSRNRKPTSYDRLDGNVNNLNSIETAIWSVFFISEQLISVRLTNLKRERHCVDARYKEITNFGLTCACDLFFLLFLHGVTGWYSSCQNLFISITAWVARSAFFLLSILWFDLDRKVWRW